ncbi:Hypothetical predicted protein [Podarcis lilfordi]|uniref:Uncharacterized protein n=1 Tax=Podarcis lilfordi TaxID=74358 RepID=A0AA35NVP0_9SAUR|nr:Hypothetical predicted protein [Podarcis lilfordi]
MPFVLRWLGNMCSAALTHVELIQHYTSASGLCWGQGSRITCPQQMLYSLLLNCSVDYTSSPRKQHVDCCEIKRKELNINNFPTPQASKAICQGVSGAAILIKIVIINDSAQ